MRRVGTMVAVIGAAIVVVIGVLWGWSKMKRTGKRQDTKETAIALPPGVSWSHGFAGVSDLAATSSGLAASVVIDTTPHLVGLDASGRLTWRKEIRHDAVLLAVKQTLFALTERRVIRIDPTDGSIDATRDIDPPLGGWARGTTLSIDDDLLVVDAQGLARLDASTLETQWQVNVTLDDENDAIQQLVYNPPWIAAVSNQTLMLISDQGELSWKRPLPPSTHLAGSFPLVLADRRVWVGLVRMQESGVRFLYELSVPEGKPGSETVIDGLAMFCPAHIWNGVLVLDTLKGLVGFGIENGLELLWSIEAPVALGACASEHGYLLAATQSGALLRVAFADGRKETLVQLPRKLVWVPPAPDLHPGVHRESAGTIERVAALAVGVAFSVSWSNDRAAIQFYSW